MLQKNVITFTEHVALRLQQPLHDHEILDQKNSTVIRFVKSRFGLIEYSLGLFISNL